MIQNKDFNFFATWPIFSFDFIEFVTVSHIFKLFNS